MIKQQHTGNSAQHLFTLAYVPVKDEAHELQVESGWEAVEFDPAGSALLALAVLAEVAVLAVQLLLLRCRSTRG